MRQRQPRLIVTFAATAMALKMEKYCHTAGIPGRLIPVPREITAGCGLSWMAKPEERKTVENGMRQGDIIPQGIYIL